MIRTNCVICDSSKLNHIHSEKNYPVTFSPSYLSPENDIVNDFELVRCDSCKCIQITNLIDPEILYKNSHNITYNTPTWEKHHFEFSQFICNTKPKNNIIELGGYSGILANHFIKSESSIPYTILDLCEQNKTFSPQIKFIKGNCELFDYSSFTNIIMSHIFEHIFNPDKFIKSILANNVDNIYVSIPNMEYSIETKNIYILHNEHTFLCTDYFIEYLFKINGYNCLKKQNFLNHSIFYMFSRTNSKENVKLIPQIEISDKLINILNELDSRFLSIDLDSECYIAPAGHYGQKIYYYLHEKYNKYILGFLDNDVSKIGNRMYGSDKYIYSPEILTKYKDIKIIIYAGPYLNEIKKQYLQINPNIIFIVI
jgi:hypothetical protein